MVDNNKKLLLKLVREKAKNSGTGFVGGYIRGTGAQYGPSLLEGAGNVGGIFRAPNAYNLFVGKFMKNPENHRLYPNPKDRMKAAAAAYRGSGFIGGAGKKRGRPAAKGKVKEDANKKRALEAVRRATQAAQAAQEAADEAALDANRASEVLEEAAKDAARAAAQGDIQEVIQEAIQDAPKRKRKYVPKGGPRGRKKYPIGTTKKELVNTLLYQKRQIPLCAESGRKIRKQGLTRDQVYDLVEKYDKFLTSCLHGPNAAVMRSLPQRFVPKD